MDTLHRMQPLRLRQAPLRTRGPRTPRLPMRPAADLIWDWTGVYGNTLLMVVEDFGGIDPATKKERSPELMSRSLYTFNLVGKANVSDMQDVQTLVGCLGVSLHASGGA